MVTVVGTPTNQIAPRAGLIAIVGGRGLSRDVSQIKLQVTVVVGGAIAKVS